MSTKTNKFKRIALVAVAGLGLGLFTSVPSQAAPTIAYLSMYDTTNGVQVTGGIAKVTVELDLGVQTRISVTGVGAVVSSENDSVSANNIIVVGTPTSGTWTDSTSTAAATDTITLTSAVAGTTTITATPLSSSGVPGTAVVKTLTWSPTGSLAVTSATAKLNDTVTYGATYASQIDTNVTLKFASSNTSENLAQFSAKFVDANGVAVSGATVVITVTGPGILSASSSNNETATSTASSAVRALICTTSAGGTCSTAIKADGTSGTSTVTFTSGTVSVSRSLTFYGSAKSYSGLFAYQNIYLVGTATTGSGYGTGGIRVTVKDANGNAVAGHTPSIISSDTTKLTAGSCSASTASGYSYCGFTPLVKGKVEFTIANASTLAAATVTTAGSVTAGSGIAAKITMAFDKKEYNPGDAGELIFKLTDAAGDPVADGTYDIAASAAYGVSFTGIFQSNATGGSTSAGTDLADSSTKVYVNNVYSLTVGALQGAGETHYVFYAPQNQGTLTADGVTRTSGNSKMTGSALGATLSASAAVTGGKVGADAAAALQAVTALASQVSAFITKINAQITTLTDLVMKIQKKVKA